VTAEPSSVASLLDDPDPEARRQGAQRISEVEGALAVSLLALALADVDWRVRKEGAAVAASVVPRDKVLAGLFDAMSDRDKVGLRNAAVEALVLIGTDSVVVAVRALAELDADGRKLAAEVLAGVPHVDGTRALVRALGDLDVNVRAAAAEALGASATAGEGARTLAVAALTDALVNGEPLGRLAALHSLTRLDAVLPWEIVAPLTRDPLLRRHAIVAAARTRDPSAIVALTAAIGDSSLAVSHEALVAVVECLAAEETFDALVREIRAPFRADVDAVLRVRSLTRSPGEPRVRGAALAMVGLLSDRDDVPELVRGLGDKDVSERAELGLRWFGPAVLPHLLGEGATSSVSVRAATLSLVRMLAPRRDSPASDLVLATVREALGDESVQVRVAAISALAALGSSLDLATITPHVTSPDARVSASAAAALTTLASRYPSEARAITASLTFDDPAAAVVACLLRGATAGHGDPTGSAAADQSFLRAALDHDDVRVRRAAVDALAAIGGPLMAASVALALADEERDVVLAAIRALGIMRQAEPLLAVLDGEEAPAVVAAALRALAELLAGADDPVARALIQERLQRETDPLVRHALMHALNPQRSGAKSP
jgi:HEAT repeat protein